MSQVTFVSVQQNLLSGCSASGTMQEAGATSHKHCLLLWPTGNEQRNLWCKWECKYHLLWQMTWKDQLVSRVCKTRFWSAEERNPSLQRLIRTCFYFSLQWNAVPERPCLCNCLLINMWDKKEPRCRNGHFFSSARLLRMRWQVFIYVKPLSA